VFSLLLVLGVSNLTYATETKKAPEEYDDILDAELAELAELLDTDIEVEDHDQDQELHISDITDLVFHHFFKDNVPCDVSGDRGSIPTVWCLYSFFENQITTSSPSHLCLCLKPIFSFFNVLFISTILM
jgi:hypothetical protein